MKENYGTRIDNLREYRDAFESSHSYLPEGWEVHHTSWEYVNGDIGSLMALPKNVHKIVHRFQKEYNLTFNKVQLVKILIESGYDKEVNQMVGLPSVNVYPLFIEKNIQRISQIIFEDDLKRKFFTKRTKS